MSDSGPARLELRPSQQAALAALLAGGKAFGALWAEPRSGKTAVALRWIEALSVPVAVVVGPKIAEVTWREEAPKWLSIPHKYFPLTAGNKYPDLDALIHDGVSILFVNYEQFGKAPFKRLRPFLKSISRLVKGGGAMLLDESHLIKTPSAITGRNIRPLAHDWKYRLLITGTPVTNPTQIDAVYGQWTFLDPDIRERWRSAKAFRDHFGEWSTVKGFPELIRPRNQGELQAYLRPHVVTMAGPKSQLKTRKVNYRLPEPVVETSTELAREAVSSWKGHTIAALNPLTRLLRLRQLAAGWCTDDAGVPFSVAPAARARLRALYRVLSRAPGKAIVACTHLYEVSMVGRYLAKRGTNYSVITGDTRSKDRVLERFRRDSSIEVLLVQPRTVAMAVDISCADMLVWFTSDFNYVTFKQASDRIKLSQNNPTVYFLCARGSVDEDVWVTLYEDHTHLQNLVARFR